ncbi:hypothetical protein FRX31_007578 [Thalictrum thalictroides]|uniref:Uncharacterized protein n=1 Tax=Thalictrum thalictroides TaxID=46969 RepID=A0A7J6WZH9_THATH|nr:hypothetical protein FRX31_007578 [Thalictrum thalictroides]
MNEDCDFESISYRVRGKKIPRALVHLTSRKVRFKPKVPSRRQPKSIENKTEVLPDIEAAQEVSRMRGPKLERKSEPVQAAFGYTDK